KLLAVEVRVCQQSQITRGELSGTPADIDTRAVVGSLDQLVSDTTDTWNCARSAWHSRGDHAQALIQRQVDVLAVQESKARADLEIRGYFAPELEFGAVDPRLWSIDRLEARAKTIRQRECVEKLLVLVVVVEERRIKDAAAITQLRLQA